MRNIPVKTLKSGFSMPVFGLGTWGMGGARVLDPNNDDAADIAAIRAAIDSGVTHIDTAELYADGHAEELIAQAIQTLPTKRSLFLASKVWKTHFSHDEMLRACERSLKRLQTSYLDLYMLHSYSTEHATLKESMRALDRLVDDGLVKNIGVSNFGKERLAEAQSYAQHKIVVNQVHYNLVCREPERKGLLEYCQQNDVFLVAWRPIAKGGLAKDVPEVMQAMCEKYQKTPAQVAINWLISQENVLTISKTRSVEHLEENLGAVGWEMEKGDIELLRNEYPKQEDVSDAVSLG